MVMDNDMPMVQGLYGSKLNRARAVGYCYYHKCHLTVATLKCHECLKKQCDCLKKHEEHDYWRQREVMKRRKKERKMGGLN